MGFAYYTLVNCKTHTITPGTGESWLHLLHRISDATGSQNTCLVRHDLARGVCNGQSFYLGVSIMYTSVFHRTVRIPKWSVIQ